ncbi:hypothetical protein D3C75_894080 [compost metagenome]
MRLIELDLPEKIPYNRIWETSVNDPARKSAHVIHEDSSRYSILFPIPYSCPEEHIQLMKTLQRAVENNFRNTEIVVVGRIPEEVEIYASKAPTGAIRWWPMQQKDSLETCIQYAKYIASCKEKVVVLP